jgi:hypothetical protein
METIKNFILSPGIIITYALILFGALSAFKAKKRNQSPLAAFGLGLMLGPIGYAIVVFNKTQEIDIEQLQRTLNPSIDNYNKKEIENIIKLLKSYIITLKRGRMFVWISLPTFLLSIWSETLFSESFLLLSLIIILIPIYLVSIILTLHSAQKLDYIVNAKAENKTDSAYRNMTYLVGWLWFLVILIKPFTDRIIKSAEDLIQELQIKMR